MPILHSLVDFIVWLGWYIVPFIVIMNGIVFFHELGHYLVGRWCGVKIEAFSLGFGPELLARVDAKGTRWRLALFPIGGYVKFLGDANAASGQDEAGARRDRPRGARPYAGGAARLQPRGDRRGRTGRQFHPGDGAVHRSVPGVRAVEPQRPRRLRRAGLAGGARRASRPATSSPPSTASRSTRFQDLQQAVVLNTGLDMTFDVDRGDQKLTLHAAPQVMLVDQGVLGKRRIGHLGLGSYARSQRRHLRTLRRRANASPGRAIRSASSPARRSPISAACSPAANWSTRCRAWSA